ncbi:MAG: bifunctional N-acetylglucosamine-1-phosphate uridyltransferase/glucosamine-1-phosphate acetyltransferase, partial [Gammaproteobacteria bacterium]
MKEVSVVVLAAGEGKRMRSRLPKVLHPLAGKPLIAHVLDTALALSPHVIAVVRGDAVPRALEGYPVRFAEQPVPRGTGDALRRALPLIPEDHRVLVLYGDVPLIKRETLDALLEAAGEGLGILTVHLPEPAGYGRILREAGRIVGIVEERDASPEQLAIDEVNTGIMTAPRSLFAHFLPRLVNANAQGELYLTDCVAMAVEEGIPVATVAADDPWETMGVNDRMQLARLERHFQALQAERLMKEGVTLLDPRRFDLRGRIVHGLDITIDTDVILEGEIRLGEGVRIGTG